MQRNVDDSLENYQCQSEPNPSICEHKDESVTSNDVQTNTTSITNIFIDLGLHVSIHYGIIIRPSLKYTDPLHKSIETRIGIPTVHNNLCLLYTCLCYYCERLGSQYVF